MLIYTRHQMYSHDITRDLLCTTWYVTRGRQLKRGKPLDSAVTMHHLVRVVYPFFRILSASESLNFLKLNDTGTLLVYRSLFNLKRTPSLSRKKTPKISFGFMWNGKHKEHHCAQQGPLAISLYVVCAMSVPTCAFAEVHSSTAFCVDPKTQCLFI